ncbi:MAG TPA: hypothetical protein VLB76_14650 [Thermoanaerobaculia bacterium]|jgi:hypothetical protein|nr:hypothetical protein [Thermoanaerobaculia bacterium]
MSLADLQRHLAASLAGRGPGPEGMDRETLERARRSLESKRRRAVGHLLPRLREALGTGWKARFAEHAARYTPSGLLYHVDDAWEMAATLAQAPDRGIAAAAQDDLVMLRLRWVRRREAGAERIRERWGPLIALTRSPVRLLVLRLPGTRGKTWRIRV